LWVLWTSCSRVLWTSDDRHQRFIFLWVDGLGFTTLNPKLSCALEDV